MFKNYLKTALRRFWRQKIFTLINVLGLSTGMAISLVMLLFIRCQSSYDCFHKHGKNIYKIGIRYFLKSEELKNYTCPADWGKLIQDNYPEVKQNTRLKPSGELLFNTFNDNGSIDKKFIEHNGAGVDSAFFNMFSFPLLYGNPNKVFNEPYSIVLSKKIATKYFGDKNPIGDVITVNNKYEFKITGVLKDLPKNTNLGYDFYFPVSFFKELGYNLDSDEQNSFQTYLLLKDGSKPDNISTSLNSFLKSRFKRDVEYEPFLVPLEKMHYDGDYLFEIIFAIIAIFILIMACINFMNLSTAASLQRSKEIAMRKIVGAQRKQLVKQLLSESILLAFFSLNIAIIFTEPILDFLHRFAGITIPLDFADFGLWLQFILLALLTGFFAGTYPALFLSSFKPIRILSYSNSSAGGGKFRKILVIFQFTLSVIFLSVTILSYRQYRIIQKDKPGIDTEQVLTFPIKGDIPNNYELIKQDLLQNPDIVSVSESDQQPTWVTNGVFDWGISQSKNDNISRLLNVDYDFLNVFGIRLNEGRFFSKDFSDDKENAIVINEVIAKAFKISDPVGKQFYLNNKPYKIIGVVKYFNFFPTEMGGRFMIMKLEKLDHGNIYLRYKKGTYPIIANYIRNCFEKYNPEYPFNVSFYSDFQNPLEKGIKSLSQSLVFFTLFGLFIAVLGLIGLCAYMVEQKTKEIGIRKAMGASVFRILASITKQFFKLILIANLIAIPLSYLIYHFARNYFTVKTTGGIFVLTGVFIFTFLIAFIVIYLITFKAAKANPAKSLRYE